MGNNESPLISLFKEQLKNEIETLRLNRNYENDGRTLIYWYFNNIYGMSFEDINEIVADGTGDLGIDAIYIDDDDLVHFYQFKNPVKIDATFAGGDVDKVISGLGLIISRNHKEVANAKLNQLISSIYKIVPMGYRLHFITSGSGISTESTTKLESFVLNLNVTNEDFIQYDVEDIVKLQDKFYRKNIPSVDKTINLTLPRAPYMLRSSNHDSYSFHLEGKILAELYSKFKEKLLQQNIRSFEGDNTTNQSIYDSSVGNQSSNFLHFNNGITFLCENAKYDSFTLNLSIEKAQVVNGGQTLRMLHRAYIEGKLKDDVLVSIRAISSGGDKDFASNVAVNLNKQTPVDTSFLRSNDQRIIQLASSIYSLKWYLERRESEIEILSDEDRLKIEKYLETNIEHRTIPLKIGAQAYTSTYYRNPELARKNPKLIFLDTDGGHFSKIFSSEISATRFINSFRLYKQIELFIEEFKTVKKKTKKFNNWKEEYTNLLSKDLVNKYDTELDQVIPQASHMILATLFDIEISDQKFNDTFVDRVIIELEQKDRTKIFNTIDGIMAYKQSHQGDDKSWQTLLKSQPFFDSVCKYLKKQ